MFFFRFYRAKLVCIALKGHCHNLSVIASSCHKLWLIASQPLFLSIHSVCLYKTDTTAGKCMVVRLRPIYYGICSNWHINRCSKVNMISSVIFPYGLSKNTPWLTAWSKRISSEQSERHWSISWWSFFIWTWHSTDYIKCFFFFIFLHTLSPYLLVCLFDNFVFDHPSNRISEWKWFNNNCNVQSKCYLCIQFVFRRILLST